MDVVLLHPPVALPCEPPIGLGLLAAGLRARGVAVELCDLSVEALEALLASVPEETARSTAKRRAVRGRGRALAQLRGGAAYASVDRYRAAIADLTQVLTLVSGEVRVGLANYHDLHLSPLASEDLRRAAREPERCPFHPSFTALAERLAADPPRLLGISVNYLHQALPALALAGVLKRRLPAVPVLLGGALLTCWEGRLEPTALQPAVDRVVFGEGLPAILERLGRGSAGASEAPRGVPDYEGVPWQRYLARERIAPASTSRGCFWRRCNYCPEALAERCFESLPAAAVPSLVDEVRRRTGAGLVHLSDSAVPPAALAALAGERWSARWYGFARFTPELAAPELARGLRRSGCAMLQLGLESASPRILARLRKGIDLAQASASLERLAGEGVAVYLYLMFNVPGEQREDALRTLEFVAARASQLAFLNVALLNLPLGNPEEPDLRYRPLAARPHDLGLYTGFVHAEGWDRRAIRHFLDREFCREPAIAAILRRTPPVFGANHAPFFVEEPLREAEAEPAPLEDSSPTRA